METVQQNGRFTLFSSKFLSIHSILYVSDRIPFFMVQAFILFNSKLNLYLVKPNQNMLVYAVNRLKFEEEK